MVNKINIEILELKKKINLIFSKIKENKIKTIIFTTDYYWDIDESQLYNPDDEPDDLTLGQLSFDIEELNQVVNKKDIIEFYHLKILSSIFRGISYELQKS